MIKSLNNVFSTAKKTVLFDLHVAHKAKMVEFAGYSLPLNYSSGMLKEHLHCREAASLFDVSHMGQLLITGPDRVKLLEHTTVGSVQRSWRLRGAVQESYLTMLLNEKAGIIDDCIVCNDLKSQQVRMVVNASNKYTVISHLITVSKTQMYDVKVDLFEDDLGLVALQGPQAAPILQKYVKMHLNEVPFMSQFNDEIEGIKVIISRVGYTGEDGFQISAKGQEMPRLVESLLKHEKVELAGLGARDSLRLEAGLCLHGHDISDAVTPFQAVLMWCVRKGVEPNRLSFLGEKTLSKQIEEVKAGALKIRKRAGFILNDPGIIRENSRILTKEGNEVGMVTSGCYSPILKKCIGMAYLDQGYGKAGTELLAEQRNKTHSLQIMKMPFVKASYYKNWSSFQE